MRAAQEAGLPYNPDFNGERQEGCGLYQVTQRGARRCSAAVGYLKPALARGNLTVLTGCHATRILIESGRAVGVEYRAGEGRAQDRARRAGGGGRERRYRLAQAAAAVRHRPGRRAAAVGVTPLHDLPGVGRNLQDHIDVYVICELAGPHSYDRHTRPHRMLWAGLQYQLFGNGPVTSNLAEGGAFWYADSEQRSPDIQFHFLPGAGLEAGVPPVAGLWLHAQLLPSAAAQPRQGPLQSADPPTAPLIDPNYWAEPYDLEMSLRGFAMTREIMAQPALRQYVKREHLPGAAANTRADLEAYARRFGKTDYHPVGTCKMGMDELAVVDPQLRVRGIDGLRVVDSSIMPRLISSNTNAASIMIGEKGSDLIKGNRAAPLAA